MRRIALTGPALADIDDALLTSLRDFGPAASVRYETLIVAALNAISEDPGVPGLRRSSEVPAGVCWYHLRSARALVPIPDRVARPRHILVVRQTEDTVTVLRMLHDAMDLSAHLR